MPESALVAMSGGVDSTIAAMLAKQSGLECTGAMMTVYPGLADGANEAQAAAKALGIPFEIYDFTAGFAQNVIAPFISEYRQGRTPNPCIECNRRIKFGMLLQKARELDKNTLVTGHYARVVPGANGDFRLLKGVDAQKDQSYVLYTLTQNQLSHVQFPLGLYTKSQVRELAAEIGLGNAQKRESQDICFIPGGDYAVFINDYTGEIPEKGLFIDTEGKVLGESRGTPCYTVGQRRGLGLAMPYRPYVIAINPEDNTVIVGRNELLFSSVLEVNNINLIGLDRIGVRLNVKVKIRYNHVEQPATVWQTGDDSLRIEFNEPQRAIAKGQAAVLYDGEQVIGGGTIC